MGIKSPLAVANQIFGPLAVGRRLAAGTAYSNKVLGYSPVAYWPMWETGGTTIEDIVNGWNGTYSDATPGDAASPDGDSLCPFFNGGDADFVTAQLQAAFDGTEGTIMVWIKVASADAWEDGVVRRAWYIWANNGNNMHIAKASQPNRTVHRYEAAGLSEDMTLTDQDYLTWALWAQTWSYSNDRVREYVGDYYQTDGGISEWSGTPSVIRALNWHGWLGHAAIWNTEKSPTDIADLATV